MQKIDYRLLAPTLTHEQIVKAGYCPFDGVDGFRRFLAGKDEGMTLEQFRNKSYYGSAPPAHRFGGTRLAPVYWARRDIALWLNQRYAQSNPEVVRAAEAAGFVIEQLPAALAVPQPKRRRTGDTRKKTPPTLPTRKWGISDAE